MLQSTPYTVPLALVVLLGVAGAALTWRKSESAAERWFVGIELSMAVWASVHLLTVSAVSLPTKERILVVGLPLLLFLPISLLGFTLHYTGRNHWVSRRTLVGLLLLPAVSAVSAATNGYHGLYYANVQSVDRGQYVLASFEWRPASTALIGLSCVIILACFGMLFEKFRRSRNVYRKLSFILLVSFGVMWLANVASFVGLSPFPHFTLLPLTFLAFGSIALLTTANVRFVRAIPLERLLSAVSTRFGGVVVMARDFIVEEIDNGVIVLDTDGVVVDINTTAKEILGVDRPVGQRISTVVDFDAIRKEGTLVVALRNDLQVDGLRDELWVDTDGGKRCYDVSVSAVTDGDDATGRVVLIHDITDQKRREEQLRERERTLQQRTTDLEQRSQQLEHQNEQLDQFASIVSHDLRNPLNVASGHAELLAAEVETTDEVDSEHVGRIVEAHERMGDIIDDALELARQGKAITETESVELAGLAAEAWENVGTDGSTLVVETDRTVGADRDRLLNVFENLFRNSVEHGSTGSRYSSSAGDTVEHATDGESEPRKTEDGATEEASVPAADGVTVTVGDTGDGFYVADDGDGIPEDKRDDVLEQGYTTSGDGTGLGLAIVDDIARAHGWTVSVTESVDGGARFEFAGVEPPGETVGHTQESASSTRDAFEP